MRHLQLNGVDLNCSLCHNKKVNRCLDGVWLIGNLVV